MSRVRAYLDHNATSSLRPEARAAISAMWELAGNASSVHAEGREARSVIETSRAEVAAVVGADTVVFTSGATEALNMALTPNLSTGLGVCEVLLVSAGEHSAVLAGHRFGHSKVEIVPVTPKGVLDLGALQSLLERQRGRRVMLALQAANNETGVVQPVSEAAAYMHAAGGLLICDAVQAPGKIACNIKALGADVLVISGHKFGGPQGSGALCFARTDMHIAEPILRGGGQERGFRAGTENVAAIAGMAAALKAASRERQTSGLRDRAEASMRLVAPDAVVFGDGAARLPNTTCFAVPGLDADLMLMGLDLEGVSVSSGSACSSGKVTPSHVLAAMGVAPETARGAIRVSFGWTSCDEDVEIFARAFEKVVGRIRARRFEAAA